MLRPLDVWIRQEQWDLQSVPTTESSIFAGASRPVLGSLCIESSGCHGRPHLTAGWGAASLVPWTLGPGAGCMRGMSHTFFEGRKYALCSFGLVKVTETRCITACSLMDPRRYLPVWVHLVRRYASRLDASGGERAIFRPKEFVTTPLDAEGSGGTGAEFRRLALGLSALFLFRPARVFGRIPFFG